MNCARLQRDVRGGGVGGEQDDLRLALGFNEEELLSYVWLKAMGNRNENAQNVIGVEKPAPLEIGYTSPPSPPSEPGSGD